MKCECCDNDSLLTETNGMRLCGPCAQKVIDNDERMKLLQPTIEEGFPKHVCLYLEHNDHKGVYETLPQWLEHNEVDWVSDEQKAKALAENSCWTLQWYPDTPIGFFKMAACDLEVLLAEVNK